MIKVFIAPRRYVQGVGVLADIGKYIVPLGKRALVIWGPVVSDVFGEPVAKSMKEQGIELISFRFSGECDRGRVNLGIEKAKAGNADVIIGLGGGKAIDLAQGRGHGGWHQAGIRANHRQQQRPRPLNRLLPN